MDSFILYLRELILWLPALLIAMTFHEYAHAYVAYRLGDPTAKQEGRLTLNPLKHIDIIGFIALLILKIGWAKPVPVNIYNLRNPVRDMGIIALAGPLMNFLIAFLSLALYIYVPMDDPWRTFIMMNFQINIVFGVFNLTPFPPLDGWRILTAIFPKLMLEPKYEFYGFWALIIFVVLFGDIFSMYLFTVSKLVANIFISILAPL